MEEKDKQFEQKDKQIEQLQKLLDQQQQLQLKTQNQLEQLQLEYKQEEPQETETESETPQKYIFRFWKNKKDYKTYEQVAIGIMDYINYYNYDRPQSQLNKLTPREYDEYLTFPNYNHKYLPMVLNH